MTSKHKHRKDVTNRLSRIEGHIRGIQKMVEDERGCSELLLQIGAVQAALKKVGQIVLEDHIETCLVEAVREGEHEAHLNELKEALSRIM